MQYYPLLLNLRRTNVAIIGAGRVGRRKLFSLLPCQPASIALFDPSLQEKAVKKLLDEIDAARTDSRCPGAAGQMCPVAFHPRGFTPRDINGIGLLFAATDNRKVNEEAAELCREKGIWCNIADAESESDFIVPAAVRREGVTIAVATNGKSPALTRKIKSDIDEWLGTRYSSLSTLMGRLRPMVLALEETPQDNTRLFRSLVASPLIEHLESGDRISAAEELQRLLPSALHDVIGELLHDL